MRLGDCLHEVTLSNDEDQHIRRFDALGSYSTKSAYRAFLNGSVMFESWHRLCKCWAPRKCKSFIWLIIQSHCWMTNRLARRGMSYSGEVPFM
jgi:hypothetical protein